MTASASTVLENILAIGPATVTGVTTAATVQSNTTLTFGGGVPAGVVPGMMIYDATTPAALTAATTTVVSTTPTTVTMSAGATSTTVGSGDTIRFGTVTTADKTSGYTKGADYRGLVNLLLNQTQQMMFTAATVKGMTDGGDTQTLANLTEILALLSVTPYALPSS
jgi:hypothetical protein